MNGLSAERFLWALPSKQTRNLHFSPLRCCSSGPPHHCLRPNHCSNLQIRLPASALGPFQAFSTQWPEGSCQTVSSITSLRCQNLPKAPRHVLHGIQSPWHRLQGHRSPGPCLPLWFPLCLSPLPHRHWSPCCPSDMPTTGSPSDAAPF